LGMDQLFVVLFLNLPMRERGGGRNGLNGLYPLLGSISGGVWGSYDKGNPTVSMSVKELSTNQSLSKKAFLSAARTLNEEPVDSI
jgi:hypothetical protein